jgi:hypothetical protein
VVLSLLVIEDLAMAAYLPVLTGLLVGGSLLATQLHVTVALVVVAAVLVVALRFGDLLSRLVFSPSDEVLLLVILGLTLMVAGLAERLQVSAAVGQARSTGHHLRPGAGRPRPGDRPGGRAAGHGALQAPAQAPATRRGAGCQPAPLLRALPPGRYGLDRLIRPAP